MTQRTRNSYVLAVGVLGASAIGLATTVLLPFTLAPAEYVTLSLAIASSQLLSNILTEWLRVGIIRHGSGSAENMQIQQSIAALYTWVVVAMLMTAAILFAAFAAGLIRIEFGLVCVCGAFQAAFDGRSALARARFDNLRLAIASVVRALVMCSLVLGVTSVTGSARYALVGLAASYPVSLLVFKDEVGKFLSQALGPISAAGAIFRLGGSAALGTNISLAVSALLRTFFATALGPTASGGVILALDLGQRIFSTIGLALNTLYLQHLIRDVDYSDRNTAALHIRGFITNNSTIIVLATTLSASLAPILGYIFAPATYRAAFSTNADEVFLMLGVMCVRQYAVDPAFVAYSRTNALPIPPGIMLLGIPALMSWHHVSALNTVQLLLSGLGLSLAALVAAAILLRRISAEAAPWPELLLIFGAGCAALVATSLIPQFPFHLDLAFRALVPLAALAVPIGIQRSLRRSSSN